MNPYNHTSQTKHRPQGQIAPKMSQFIPHSCQPIKKPLQWAGVMIDNKDLSKSHSGQASRYPLAFFVLKNRVASQVTDHDSTTHLPPFTGGNHHIFMADLPAVYDGVTLQNKPTGEYAGRFYVTESEPHHPMTFHSVVTTQNYIGGHNHA